MGGSYWSDDAYAARQNRRSATGSTAFTYDAHVRSTGNVEVHPQMNPYGVTRESRDSDAHPSSLAIAVIFDVTGSMGSVPRTLQTKLGALMRVLVQKGYVEHPQILFGAVGDAYCDQVPLQIGQFESGLEMDDELGKIYIEGGGGGQVYESYELAMYMMARHTSIDCYEKRGHKGYLFTIGDEHPYASINRKQVAAVIGDRLQADLPLPKLLAELHERYEHFHIIPTNTSHGGDKAIQQGWQKLLGERVLMLADEGAVCETVALAIGLSEGVVGSLKDAGDDLMASGYDDGAVATASAALVPYASKHGGATRTKGLLGLASMLNLGGRL